MRKVLGSFIIFSTVFSFGQVAFAQGTGSNCKNPNGGWRAAMRVKLFLTLPEQAENRVTTGAINESVQQIQPVSDEAICTRLTDIVRNNPKYAMIDSNLSSDKTRYYYRTENLFYIFWARKPEYDNQFFSGPRIIFLVVNKNYSNVWEFDF